YCFQLLSPLGGLVLLAPCVVELHQLLQGFGLSRPRDRLAEQRLRRVEPAASLVETGEVLQADERVGVVGTQLGAPTLQSLLKELLRLVVAPLCLVEPGEAMHACERVGVVGTEFGAAAL